MILAAGRGTRMGALTDKTPKPLLPLAGMPLIEYHIRALASAGFDELVINVAWLGEQIVDALGTGRRFGVDIAYSREPDGALETAGGIAHALPLLGSDPFVVINADVWSDFPLHTLRDVLQEKSALRTSAHPAASARSRKKDVAHLIMVANPEHNPDGDFWVAHTAARCETHHRRLVSQPRVRGESSPHAQERGQTQRYTFSGIGVYRPEAFANVHGRAALGPLLKDAIAANRVSACVFAGYWWDVGTPARLERVERFLCGGNA